MRACTIRPRERKKKYSFAILLILLIQGRIEAQDATSSFDALVSARTLEEGEEVVVTYVDGGESREERAGVVALGSDRIVLRIDEQEIALPEASVRTIVREGDSIWDGARRGGLIVGGIGLGIGGVAAATACRNEGGGCGDVILAAAGIGAGLGFLTGLALDASRKDRITLYQAPGLVSMTRPWVVAPFFTPDRQGIFVGFRF